MPDARRTSTYVIINHRARAVKIGKTSNPIKMRLQDLQAGSPDLLEIGLVFDGDHERKLHARFASDRLHGEWFTVSPDLRGWLKGYGVTMLRLSRPIVADLREERLRARRLNEQVAESFGCGIRPDLPFPECCP